MRDGNHFVDDPARQCHGKVVYLTKKMAKLQIRRHRHIHLRSTLSAYRCPHCRYFHIGGDNHAAYSTRPLKEETA